MGILDIPVALNTLDQDVYAPGAVLAQGCPSDAWLGRQTARNDRKLHAVLRRAWGDTFPIESYNLPVVRDLVGTEVASMTIEITPGTRLLHWYVRGLAGLNLRFYARAWCEGPDSPQPFRVPTADLVNPDPDAVLLTGTYVAPGDPPINYGPIPCRVKPGTWTVGLTIWSVEADAYSGGGGIIAEHSNGSIRAPYVAPGPGPFNFILAGGYTAICLTRNTGGAPGWTAFTPWYSITRVYGSGGAGAPTDDVVDIWPPTLVDDLAGSVPQGTQIGYQVYYVPSMTLYSWYCREPAFTGSLGSRP